MKYSAIIFDWDGVLGMTLHLWLDGYRSELKKLGFTYSDRVIIDDIFYEQDKASKKYPEIDFDIFLQEVHKYLKSHVSSLKTYTDAHDALEKLQKNNITLTLVSSSQRKLLKESLKQTGLDKFFLTMVADDGVMRRKPAPDPFLNIIEIAKLNPETTLILGDSYADIVAAKAANIDSCLFLPPENKIFYDFNKLKKTNPTYCVENLQDFAEMVINM